MTFNHGVRSSNLRWVTKFFQKITEKQFLGDFFAYESRKCYESGQTFRGRLSVTGWPFGDCTPFGFLVRKNKIWREMTMKIECVWEHNGNEPRFSDKHRFWGKFRRIPVAEKSSPPFYMAWQNSRKSDVSHGDPYIRKRYDTRCFLLFRIIDKIGRLQYQKSFLRYCRQNSTVPIDIVFKLLYNVCKEVLIQFRKK